MLKKRKHKQIDDASDNPEPEKRRRFAIGHRDSEQSSAAMKYLKKYESQRQLANNKARFRKSLRKVATCKISELAKLSKLATAAKDMKDRKPAPKPKPVITIGEDGEPHEKEAKA